MPNKKVKQFFVQSVAFATGVIAFVYLVGIALELIFGNIAGASSRYDDWINILIDLAILALSIVVFSISKRKINKHE
jgi:hypothetical protein